MMCDRIFLDPVIMSNDFTITVVMWRVRTHEIVTKVKINPKETQMKMESGVPG